MKAKMDDQDQDKKILEKNTRLSLALEAALNENKFIKAEIINLKTNKNQLESSLKNSNEKCEKYESIIKKFNSQIEIWKLKFKSLNQKLNDLELVKNKIDTKIESLLFENQKLRSITAHNACIVSGLNHELDTLKKTHEELVSKLGSENETLVLKMSILESRNDEIENETNKLRVLCEELKAENDKINKEKSQVELQSIKMQQNLINLTSSNKKLEQLLNERTEMNKIIESERRNIQTEFNDFKILVDLEHNELRAQIKKLDLSLKSEIDEKNNLKIIVGEKEEQIYISELNNKDLIEKLKKYESKKKLDNFTQTIFLIKNLNLEHRFTQTMPQTKASPQTPAYTQTPRVLTKNIFTQTVRFNYENIAVQTDGLSGLSDSSNKQNFNKIEYKDFNRNLGVNRDGWDLKLLSRDSDDDNYPCKKKIQKRVRFFENKNF